MGRGCGHERCGERAQRSRSLEGFADGERGRAAQPHVIVAELGQAGQLQAADPILDLLDGAACRFGDAVKKAGQVTSRPVRHTGVGRCNATQEGEGYGEIAHAHGVRDLFCIGRASARDKNFLVYSASYI